MFTTYRLPKVGRCMVEGTSVNLGEPMGRGAPAEKDHLWEVGGVAQW